MAGCASLSAEVQGARLEQTGPAHRRPPCAGLKAAGASRWRQQLLCSVGLAKMPCSCTVLREAQAGQLTSPAVHCSPLCPLPCATHACSTEVSVTSSHRALQVQAAPHGVRPGLGRRHSHLLLLPRGFVSSLSGLSVLFRLLPGPGPTSLCLPPLLAVGQRSDPQSWRGSFSASYYSTVFLEVSKGLFPVEGQSAFPSCPVTLARMCIMCVLFQSRCSV